MTFDPKPMARALLEFMPRVYPELSRAEFVRVVERTRELLKATDDDDYRPEDLMLTMDQACSEVLNTPHRMNPNWFTLTGMLRDNHKPEEPEDGAK